MERAREVQGRRRTAPWGVLAAAVVGLAAAVIVTAVRHRGRRGFDANSIIEACDRAADRLETAILGDHARAS